MYIYDQIMNSQSTLHNLLQAMECILKELWKNDYILQVWRDTTSHIIVNRNALDFLFF